MAKEDPVGDLRVTVQNDAIVVTMPRTRYSITYRKGDESGLLASDIREDPDFPSYKFTFQEAGPYCHETPLFRICHVAQIMRDTNMGGWR